MDQNSSFEIEYYKSDIINIVIEYLEQNDVSIDLLGCLEDRLDQAVQHDDYDYKAFCSSVEELEVRTEDLENIIKGIEEIDIRTLQYGLYDLQRIDLNFSEKGDDLISDLSERLEETEAVLETTLKAQNETIEELLARLSDLETEIRTLRAYHE